MLVSAPVNATVLGESVERAADYCGTALITRAINRMVIVAVARA